MYGKIKIVHPFFGVLEMEDNRKKLSSDSRKGLIGMGRSGCFVGFVSCKTAVSCFFQIL